MNTNLEQQALDLASNLSRAYYQEEAKRDRYFNPAGDPIKLARLRRAWEKAADRWRRRRGVAPLYR